MMKIMKWLEKFFKREAAMKVDLPEHWPLPAPPRPKPGPKPAGPAGVINLAGPPELPKTNKPRGRINTPVPAKKGTKTLNLAGKQDAFNRRSKSVIDMRNKKTVDGRR